MTRRASLPLDYVCNLSLFGWSDIKWALQAGVMTSEDVIAFALRRVNEMSSEQEFRLAGLDPRAESAVEKGLDKLAAAEGGQTPESKARWVFATVLYRFETAPSAEELLQSVDDVYCDFGHPDEMYGLVSWLPPLDGYDASAHTFEENRRRLVKLVYDYLSKMAQRFNVRQPRYQTNLP